MGCTTSTRSNITKSAQIRQRPTTVFSNLYGSGNMMVESIHHDDIMFVNGIKKELNDNAPVFVLNNLIMAQQFFSNHKELTTRLQSISASSEEMEMNKTLLKNETMECIFPDPIMDEVNKNIIFRTTGEECQPEALVTRRIYVTNDLIEVVRSDEIPQYTSIDKPCYQVKIEECTRKGFLKLCQIENNVNILKNQDEYDDNYDSLPGTSSQSDSDYDYSRITDLRTPKPIETDGVIERRDTLPETCFTRRKQKCHVIPLLDDEDESIKEAMLQNMNESDFYKEIIYINSQGFMKYFQNGLFPNSLGTSLGFSDEAISAAKAIPGKIFCDEYDFELNTKIRHEIIPAVVIPWPYDQTIEFIYREDRPTRRDLKTGVQYKWPTTGAGSMMEEICDMTAVLIPKGYTKKKGVNRNSNLEWELSFPKTGRYLEARMSHAQMKSMLLLFTLHKTYIAPVTKQYGLLVEHIRTHMYWECERDYLEWPEHRLGTKILRVIKNLQQALFLGTLPDYFIRERNLVENIPRHYLNFAQKKLMDILENPVPYFIKALGNLRYSSGKFYPALDYKEIYDSLTTQNSAGLVNSKLTSNIVPQLKRRFYHDPDQQMKHIQYLKKKEQIFRERQREKQDHQKHSEFNETETFDNDSINLDVSIGKDLDIWKTKKILGLFIQNFIDIAKKSSKLSTSQQTLFYLKQATYLIKILEDTSAAFLDEMTSYRNVIAREEALIRRTAARSLSSSESKPPTPQRNSVTFQFTDAFQQLKSGSIKLNNLQTSYMNGMQPPPAMRNLKPLEAGAVTRSESYKKHNGNVAKKKVVAFAE